MLFTLHLRSYHQSHDLISSSDFITILNHRSIRPFLHVSILNGFVMLYVILCCLFVLPHHPIISLFHLPAIHSLLTSPCSCLTCSCFIARVCLFAGVCTCVYVYIALLTRFWEAQLGNKKYQQTFCFIFFNLLLKYLIQCVCGFFFGVYEWCASSSASHPISTLSCVCVRFCVGDLMLI